MSENDRAEYVWHPEKNKSFNGSCHIETGNTWLRFEFKSDLGRIERPQDLHGNPMLILHEGKVVALRGAVTISGQEPEQTNGTVTFTPQDEGFTDWHWTMTRDGQTYTEEGRGIFLRDDLKPKPARAKVTPRKTAATKKQPKKTAAKKQTKKAAAKTKAKKTVTTKKAKKVVKAKKTKRPAVKSKARGRRR